ncbi:tetratricopeptide repeat protein [Brevundimonas sp.]|uniref:tetratricopeptide repeat protein n=1 Tax=Brevundimonas sp. TaxID=1871086 RepID=UPI002D3044C2|nr:tetratricopeptide repeat protein [Brevundimonas sp.]HYC98475.1 tetratricopeptide repeat protein [Brevundimonas sp.]
MSGATSKRILRTTVAAAAAGAVVFAPLAPLAQEAGAALDPISIRIGANAEFTRIEFAGVVGSRSRVRREGDQVIVRIGSTAAPDVSRLKVDPPKGVVRVETRAVQGATELVLTLAAGADARSGVADGAVYLNLYAEAPAAPAGSAARTVPVVAQASAGKVTLAFRWPVPVGAAVFRRGEAVWIVFDTPARLDMSGATQLGPASDAHWTAGPDHVAIRVAAPANAPVSAAADGSTWTVSIGGPPVAVEGVRIDRDDTGKPVLIARMAGATRAIWLTDPLVGDRFAAVTALAPGKGFADRRRTVDLALLPTAHGLAVETAAADLAVHADGDLVTLSRPGGLTLSSPSAGLDAAAVDGGAPVRARHPGLILSQWADVGHAGFPARYRQLQDAAALEANAAGEDPRAPVEARFAFARFLVGSGLGYEAIGVLNAIVAKAPNMAGEPELRGLRGAARASIGRFEEAGGDFASAAVAGDPASAVWRGYMASAAGDHAAARQAFAAGAKAVDAFPTAWRARFGAAHALSALETGDLEAARSLLAYSFSQNAPAADQLTARLVQARLFELDGQSDRALAVYTAIGRAPRDAVAVPARLAVVRLSLARGAMKPDAAAAALESLRWRWRGDATELAVIRQLGQLYLSQGLYREALTALKGAGPGLNRLDEAADIQADLGAAFRMLFLEGGADGLQPVQALGLFYDFRELTPIGADGDEMVRRLARRLVDVDLLDQAAELLKYQVDNRLEGVAKAQVATDLATVYLMDRQPEAALQAIWGSRTTLLPTPLNAERRALEARALAGLGRYDHALEVLGADASPEGRDVRAEVLWKQEKWAEAAALYEARLGDRFRNPAALSVDEEARLIRAGVGYSLGRDAGALTRLSRNYRPFVAGARGKSALAIALDAGEGDGPSAGDFAALTASADTFAGWVSAMKAELRQKTGGNRPAAPARPQASN